MTRLRETSWTTKLECGGSKRLGCGHCTWPFKRCSWAWLETLRRCVLRVYIIPGCGARCLFLGQAELDVHIVMLGNPGAELLHFLLYTTDGNTCASCRGPVLVFPLKCSDMMIQVYAITAGCRHTRLVLLQWAVNLLHTVLCHDQHL